MISIRNLLLTLLESDALCCYYGFRLIKEFDREIKDEGSRNSEEMNKQLNDEKQSMVNTQNPFFYSCNLAHVGNLVSTSSKFGRGSRSSVYCGLTLLVSNLSFS